MKTIILYIKYIFRLTLIPALIISTYSCEEMFIGSQPKFLEEFEVEPALNIFGILRPDSVNGAPTSFVTVGIIAPTTNDTSESWLINDAIVKITEMDGSCSDTIALQHQEDTLGQKFYFNKDFVPKAGKSYVLSCAKEGYETVYAQATIPPKPTMLNIKWDNNNLNLVLQNDTSIRMYDIYAQTKEGSGFKRFLPEPGSTTTEINEAIDSKPIYIDIYAYEHQLANYYGSTNVFIKPNTYRQAFSTVENGYGCLGALNHIRLYLD